MTEKLKNITPQLTEKYINILEENGEPNEAYKYLAIDTFQQNWDLEAGDFNQMFLNSFSEVKNLLYHSSLWFIKNIAQNFPEETRNMFRSLYDESEAIKQRINAFQSEAERLLEKVRQTLNRDNINAYQDERTISVYLAFRFPEKYILYKSDFYKRFCKELNIKPQKSGECFLHFQELANQIIQGNLLDEDFIKTYRKFYQKPNWDDKYLMIQNVLYVVFRDFKENDLVKLLKDFNQKDLEKYYHFLDEIIEKFNLQQEDKRLVFNLRDKKTIVLTIGQRYIWCVRNSKSNELTFGVISTDVFTKNHINYEGNPAAYLNNTTTILEVKNHQAKIFEAISEELNRSQNSGYSKHNNKELEQMAFDLDFRNEILSQLDNQTEKSMKNTQSNKKTPLNQILFGAPGTGKTYNTKKIAIEIINGVKERTREEINEEYENLVNAKQIVFTTFHQSLSYEDFIEGIKPILNTINENETDDDRLNSIDYEIKDGIFKRICDLAKSISQKKFSDTIIDFDNSSYYKMSLGGKSSLEKHNWAIENNLIFINWGDDKDFSKLNKINDWETYRNTFKKEYSELVVKNNNVIRSVYNFQKMKIGDIVIISKGNSIIDAIGIIESEYFYDNSMEIENYQFRKVKWISKNLNFPTEVLINKGLTQRTIYQLNKKDVKTDILNEMFNKVSERINHKKYVFIIDEINRGNVSAIFGELITLLEEDKRKGNKEQTEVTLPYSGDKFSVPNNVYVIGTMNTADRSVEALDTALRRRFSFIEMQPNPEILLDSEYQDVDLKRLLETINQRIEILIDKDHQIGHAYFIGIENLEDLKLVFKDKIIPLLEEYFYGDFGKIGLVLGGSFIYQEENSTKFPKNFNYENDFLEDKKVYRYTSFEDWNEQTFSSVYDE